MTIRLAIGASRRRIVQQVLIESALPALIGGAAGLVFAGWGSRLLLGFFVSADRIFTVSTLPDCRVLAFTADAGFDTAHILSFTVDPRA